MYLLWRRLTQAGQILWSSLDFSGSNLTDLATRNHVDLQNHNTTDYYHLTQANHTDLTDGGDSTLHYHSADRVTVTDSTSINFTLTGQDVTAVAIFGSTAGTVAEGNHNHSGVYEPADADLTAIAALSLTSNQVLGKDNAGTGWEGKTLTEGSNVTITHGAGTVTIASSVSSAVTSTIYAFAAAHG
jgi:hypothetical protein